MGAAPRRRNIALAGSHRTHPEGAKAVECLEAQGAYSSCETNPDGAGA